VEEKLAQVSNSDDILQTMQVQIRRLDDVIKETEEKYKRMEKKSDILQATTEGVDRNFKTLQGNEQSVERLGEAVETLKSDLDKIQNSVQALASENEKAKDAAEKLSTLDETVTLLEKRIAEMFIARESLARMNTDMEKLDRDIQTQLKLTRSLLDREAGKTAARAGKAPDDGAPPPRDRENVIQLKRKGWTIDEIARSLKMSKGEVELILEIGSKDHL
jgi:predicted RNase H-like nuclease (RuvC/YqgF family)